MLVPGPVARAGRRSAFTLVEMLAVLVIITILFTFVVSKVMRGEDMVRVRTKPPTFFLP